MFKDKNKLENLSENEKRWEKIREIGRLREETIENYKEKIKKTRMKYSNDEKTMNKKLEKAKQEKVETMTKLDDMMADLGYDMVKVDDKFRKGFVDSEVYFQENPDRKIRKDFKLCLAATEEIRENFEGKIMDEKLKELHENWDELKMEYKEKYTKKELDEIYDDFMNPKELINKHTEEHGKENLKKAQNNKIGNKGQVQKEEIVEIENDSEENFTEIAGKKKKKPITLSMDEDLIKILKNEAESINDLTGKNYKYTDLIRSELNHKQKAYQKVFDRLPIESFCNYLMKSDMSQTISNIAQNNNIPEEDKMDIINFLTNYIYKIVNNIKEKEKIKEKNILGKSESYSQKAAREFMDDQLKSVGYKTKMSTLAFELTNGIGDDEKAEMLIKTFFFIYHYIMTEKNINPNATNESMKEISSKISQTIEKIQIVENDLKNSSTLTKLEGWYELMDELDRLSQQYAQSAKTKFTIDNVAPFINMVLNLNADELRTLALTNWHRLSTFYKNRKIRLIKLIEEIENLKTSFGWYRMEEELKNEKKAEIILEIEELIRSEHEKWDEIGQVLDGLYRDYIAQNFSKEYFNVSDKEMLNIVKTMPYKHNDSEKPHEDENNENEDDSDSEESEMENKMHIEDLSDLDNAVEVRNLGSSE